jgi:hypothetical protein
MSDIRSKPEVAGKRHNGAIDPRPTSAAMRQYHRPHTVAERNVGALGFKLDARAPDVLRAGCEGAVTGFTASGVGIAGMPM